MFLQMDKQPLCVCVMNMCTHMHKHKDIYVHVHAPHQGLTFEHGTDPPDPQAALACKLAEGELHEEERDPAEDQHDEVGEHEGAWHAGRGQAQGGLGEHLPECPSQNSH